MKTSHLTFSANQHRIQVWPSERPDAVAHYFISPRAEKRLTTGAGQFTYGPSTKAPSPSASPHDAAGESRERASAPRWLHPLVLALVRANTIAPQSGGFHQVHPWG